MIGRNGPKHSLVEKRGIAEDELSAPLLSGPFTITPYTVHLAVAEETALLRLEN